jgi:hypothetical protein
VVAVSVVGARAVELGYQALDLRHVALVRGDPFGHAKAQFAILDFGEFDAAHAQADAPVVPLDPLDARERGDPAPGFRPIGSGPAAGVQTGVQIAAVGRIDAGDKPFPGVAE